MAQNTSRIQGQDIQTIAAGESTIISNKDRSQEMAIFTVANLSTVASTKIIYVGGTDKVPGIPVFPQQVISLEMDCPFSVINLGVASVNYVVCQVFGGSVGFSKATPRKPSSWGGFVA